MAAGDADTWPLGRTDVSSLTEMVSVLRGDSGSGVDDDDDTTAAAVAAARKENMMSLS